MDALGDGAKKIAMNKKSNHIGELLDDNGLISEMVKPANKNKKDRSEDSIQLANKR